MVLDGAASARVTSEQLVMACSRHEKEHREREVEIRSGRQKRYPRVFGHLRRRRSPVRGGFGGHPDHDLMVRPDEEPDVQEHDDAKSAPDRDRYPPRSSENPVAMPVHEMRPH